MHVFFLIDTGYLLPDLSSENTFMEPCGPPKIKIALFSPIHGDLSQYH